MKLLPNEADRKPNEVNFWVPRKNGGEMSPIMVRETSNEVEARLLRDFPVYKAKCLGTDVLRKVMRGGKTHEV